MRESSFKDLFTQKRNGVLSTGIAGLDRLLFGGFLPGHFYVLGARPGTGKLSLLLQIASHCALKEKASVALFSPSTSKKQILQRLLSPMAKVDFSCLIDGYITNEDVKRLDEALHTLNSASLYIDDTCVISATEMLQKCVDMQKNNISLGLVIINSMQDIEHSRTKEGIKVTATALREMSSRLNVPVIVSSALKHGESTYPFNKPRVSTDFGEYCELANIADNVVLQYRHSYYKGLCDMDEMDLSMDCEIYLAKGNNGITSQAYLKYVPGYLTFEDYMRYDTDY